MTIKTKKIGLLVGFILSIVAIFVPKYAEQFGKVNEQINNTQEYLEVIESEEINGTSQI